MIERLLELLIWCLSRLPEASAVAMSQRIARVLIASKAEAARIARINIALCFPDLPENDRQHMCKGSLANSVLLAYEFARLRFADQASIQKKIVKVDGAELLSEAWQQDQGVLLLTPHLGCWEVLGAYLGESYPVSALYDRPNLAALEKIILDMRQRFGATMHAISGAGLRNIIRAMRKGHLVVLLPDQVPDYQSGGAVAPFFEQDAFTMLLAQRLLQKSKAKVLMASAVRSLDSNGIAYHLMFCEAEPGILADDPEVHATALNASIEKLIGAHPEQYQWSYKRFKRLKKGEANIYRRQ